MSRYRLYPTPNQQAALLRHCASARFVWNLAIEQRSWWQPGRGSAPGFSSVPPAHRRQGRVPVAGRGLDHHPAASVARLPSGMVELRRCAANVACTGRWIAHWERQAPPGPPSWRKRGVNEGFRVVAVGPGKVWRLNCRWGAVMVPKLGWVRFRWSRAVPAATSYRVTCDRAGRWHVAFAAIPPAIPAPGNGRVVGVDRGVTVSAALSTGELLVAPSLRPAEERAGCACCNGAWRAPSGALTDERAPSALSPGCTLGRPTAAPTGWSRPRPTWLAASTQSGSRT